MRYFAIFLILFVPVVLMCVFGSTKKRTPVNECKQVKSEVLDSTVIKHYEPIFKNKYEVEIFVSPIGNDAASGTRDNPLATPEKARDIIRLIRQHYQNRNKKFIVTFLEGTYKINKTVFLSAIDGGNEGFYVLYRGEKGKAVLFTGGRTISKQYIQKVSSAIPAYNELDSSARSNIYLVELNKLGINKYGEILKGGAFLPLTTPPVELFISDYKMTLARWPNVGYTDVDSVIDSLTFLDYSSRMSRWAKESDLWAVGYWQYAWADYRLPVNFVSPQKNLIQLASVPGRGNQIIKKCQWFVYNCLSELDTAGEYYIDKDLGYLYFIPPHNINVSDMDISISEFGEKNSSFIQMDSAQYIRFENITLQDSRGAGINIINSNNIELNHIQIKNLGTYGIRAIGENCMFSNVSISNMGAYGIYVEGGDRKLLKRANNVVSNCSMHTLGRTNLTYASYGISLNGVGNTVSNCEISSLPHTAIFFQGNYHVIEKSRIHDVCLETDDAGAIYCGRDWALRGNIIRYNYIYNIDSKYISRHHKGVHAIYLDDCASGISIFGNIICNARNAGVLNSGGRDNHIENNIFVNCRYAHKADRSAQQKNHNDQMYNLLEEFNYQKPPWSIAFPELAKMSKSKTELVEFLNLEKLEILFPDIFRFFKIKYKSDWNPDGCTFSKNIIYKNKYKNWLQDTRTKKARKYSPFMFYTIKDNMADINGNFVGDENFNFHFLDHSSAYPILRIKRIPFENTGIIKIDIN